jgi:hypothetical protein
MALPINNNYTDELQTAILKLLWTHQLDGQTRQKRRLVAKKRLGAGLEMGGLSIQPLENTVQGFQQNLLQKRVKGEPASDWVSPATHSEQSFTTC